MSIADQPFPRHVHKDILDPTSERLPYKDIVQDRFQGISAAHISDQDQQTSAQQNGRINHSSGKTKTHDPSRARSGETRKLSPPVNDDHKPSRAPLERTPAVSRNTQSPAYRPAVRFDKSDKQNEVPPRTAVINGIEHRAGRDRLGIVVVHPHALFRDCFIRCLEASYSDYDIFAFARISDWASCTDRNAASPSVIVLFMDGTKASGPADLQFLDSTASNIPIVVMSDIEDTNYVMRALKGGARGYIPTSLPFNVAVEAVRLVEAGGTFVPASSIEFGRGKKEMPQQTAELLTERQMMVVGALCRGMANKRIAFELNMSEHTVKVHLRHIMRKLKARNRTEVAVLTKDYFQA